MFGLDPPDGVLSDDGVLSQAEDVGAAEVVDEVAVGDADELAALVA